MSLISLVVALVVVGVLLYVVERVIPIDPVIKQIIRGVVIVAVVLYLLAWVFGPDVLHPLIR